jgi:hypothetical protein
MSPDNFNKDFARAFTQDCSLYSPTEEYRHGNLLFMQFGGAAGEMRFVAVAVSKQMYQSQLVSLITRTLKNRCIPQIGLLCTTANNIIEEFNTYLQHEPYTSNYFLELIHTLKSFYELVNLLIRDVCERISNDLKDINDIIYNPDHLTHIDSLYLYPAVDQIEFYLKNLLTYYYHFLTVKQQENENGKGIGLTTQVADCLCELIGQIEMTSDDLENVLDIILSWEVCMEMCEEQALYN